VKILVEKYAMKTTIKNSDLVLILDLFSVWWLSPFSFRLSKYYAM
jgi:hypothetical protein